MATWTRQLKLTCKCQLMLTSVAFRSHILFLRMHFSIFTPFPDNAAKIIKSNKSSAYSDTLLKVSLVFFKLVIFIDGINAIYRRLFCHLVRLCFWEASVRKHKEETTCLFFFSSSSKPTRFSLFSASLMKRVGFSQFWSKRASGVVFFNQLQKTLAKSLCSRLGRSFHIQRQQ